MPISKVVYGADTIIDITDTTATASDVLNNKYFYLSDGTKKQGTIAQGSEGVPVATKGAVSNHTVSITPSVTNTAGIITGGTKTGTAVSVSASELVSGTKNITGSGNTDVTNYATVSVPTGTATTPAKTITAKPTFSINSSTGVITASVASSSSITPTVSAGYITAGTAGTVSVSGSSNYSLTTRAATSYTPSASTQTIPSGVYLTGAQTIQPIPIGVDNHRLILPEGLIGV